jgi:two-component system, NarL family, sensor histidine kinase UhpB
VTLAHAMPLFWRVVLTNGLVFVAGTFVLALSPATVSERVRTTEAVVLTVGLLVIVALNALLLRSLLRPLDRLTATMREIDLRSPGLRLDEAGRGPAAALVDGFNDMLDRLETERSATRAHALTAQEAERQRIAQELHDEVGQSLTVVLLGLKQAKDRATDPEAVATVENLQETTRSALEEVRRISQRLRPGMLEDLGLLNSLASLATELTETVGIPVSKGFGPGLPSLHPEAELVVYRVAQEALTNVARHAKASSVHLGLTRRGGALVLRVADDGTGPRQGGFVEGSGIQGMRERALLVGGSLAVGRREGGGTEVVLAVPLESR